MRIVVCLPEADASPWLELLASALPQAVLDRREPESPARANAGRADYVVMIHGDREVVAEQARPKALFTASAGVAHVLAMGRLPPEVPVVRVEDAGMAGQMVRYVLAAVLRALGHGDAYRRQQREAVWAQRPARDPASFAVGVLGLGVIGTAIARALALQGFAVRGHARGPRVVAGVACHAGADGLPAFLAGLDSLVSVLPHTPATIGLLDRAALSRLNDGAHVVNIGRGSALVEADLLALLDSGKLAGATLDVFREEPLPPGHPFWQRADITVTPHVAGLTDPAATVAQIAGKIRALERGEPITGVVDRARGY